MVPPPFSQTYCGDCAKHVKNPSLTLIRDLLHLRVEAALDRFFVVGAPGRHPHSFVGYPDIN